MHYLPTIHWCFVFTEYQCPLSFLNTQFLPTFQFKLLFKAFGFQWGCCSCGLAVTTFSFGTCTNSDLLPFILFKKECKKSLKHMHQDSGYVANKIHD
jgi:hypothetical protein